MSIENASNVHLRNNIRRQLDEKNISVRDLERRSGLKHSVVRNILHGRSQNPTIKVVQSIAKELGCTIEDLLDECKEESKEKAVHHISQETAIATNLEKTSWNKDLFMDAITVIQEMFEEKKVNASKEEAMLCVEELYAYSLADNLNKTDKRFAKWIIERFLKIRK